MSVSATTHKGKGMIQDRNVEQGPIPSTQSDLRPKIRTKIDTYVAQRLEHMQAEKGIMHGTQLKQEAANKKAHEEKLYSKLNTKVRQEFIPTLLTMLRNDIREELRANMQQENESRIRKIQDEVGTVRETASYLVNNATRFAELSSIIATEVERAIAKTWDNGALQNVIEETLSESFKNTTFTEPLVKLFLNKPRLRDNQSKYASGLMQDFFQRYVVEKSPPCKWTMLETN